MDCHQIRFTTRSLPLQERLRRLRADIWQGLNHIDMAPRGAEPIDCDMTLMQLPSLRIQSGYMSAARLERIQSEAGADEYLVMAVFLDGPTSIINDGEKYTLQPGEAALFSSAGHNISLTPPSRFHALRMPRTFLSPLLTDIRDVRPTILPNNPPLKLLTHYLNQLLPLATGFAEHPDLATTATSHVRDLLFQSVLSGRQDQSTSRHGAAKTTLARAKSIISNRLSDSDLSAGLVAAELGITPRYLQKVFELTGSTCSQHILEQRLLCSYRALTGPMRHRLSITHVALNAGFNDLSYFNRSFRKRFGTTPSAVRDSAWTSNPNGTPTRQ